MEKGEVHLNILPVLLPKYLAFKLVTIFLFKLALTPGITNYCDKNIC
jgi:hypothetical protein